MFASRSRDTVEVCELGNLRLESGDVIPNFRMSYVTFGTLNSDKSNATLSLDGLRAHRESQSFWAGPGKALDADRYYIIQPDTLGAACYDPNATTSPTRSGLKMKFPRFTIRDMVMAEHRMLTECLGINHIVAVTGVSLGGAESLQWAVSFPEFMDAVIPIVPPARTNLHLTYILEAARRAIMLDPKWQAGDYPDDDPPVDGTALAWLIQNSFGTDPQWYEERFATKSEVVAASASDYFEGRANIEPRDWFYRMWAAESHNIGDTPGFGGDLAKAARAIQARVLMFPNSFDHVLPPKQVGIDEISEHIRDLKLIDLNDVAGHVGFLTPKSMSVITREIADLFQRITDGRPGLSEPRISSA